MSKRIFSLSHKLFFICVSILLISMLFESIVIYRSSYQLASESLNKSTQIIVQNHARNISDFFRRTETINELMKSEIPKQLPGLTADSEDFYAHYGAYRALYEQFNAFCSSAIGEDIYYRAHLCLHSDFPMVGFLPSPQDHFLKKKVNSYTFSIVDETNLKDSVWFKRALENGGSTFWFMEPDNPDTIWIASSIEGDFLENITVRHASIGVFLIGIDVSWITEPLNGISSSEDSLFFITDSGGRIIYAQDPSLLNQDIASLSSDTAPGEKSTVTLQDISYHTWESAVADDVRLLLFVPEHSLESQIFMELQVVLWLLFFIVLVGIILSAFFSHYITRPIRALSRHMAAQNQLSPVAPYESRDEIGILYRCFNEMVEKQQELIQQIFTYSEEQKQLKYKMLQAQINPHFLYNTLDSVGCVALMNGVGELTDILTSLADLLRYNINEPDQLVTLSDELEMVNDYIAIQQFRYDNQLRYTCEAEPDLCTARLPKSIIQPLVENGILYGGTDPSGCRPLSLHVRRTAENLVTIVIYNVFSSSSPKEDIAKRLNLYLKGGCQIKRNNSGLGIMNVQQRIRFVFGEDYGLCYEQQENRLAAVITVPFFH